MFAENVYLKGDNHGKTNRIFRKYERVEAKAVAPKERIKNFNQFAYTTFRNRAEMPERTLHGLWCAILSSQA